MPTTFIETFSETYPEAAIGIIQIIGEVDVTVEPNSSAVGIVEIIGTANIEVSAPIQAEGIVEIIGSTSIFIEGEPNQPISAEGMVEIIGSVNLTAKVPLRAIGIIKIVGEADVSYHEPEIFMLSLIVDVYPATNPRRTRARLIVDGNELAIERYSLSVPENQSTTQLQITLADINDRNAIGRYSSVQFQIGQFIGGDWDWDTWLDVGQVESSQYSLSRDRDTFTFTGKPESYTKLSMTPQSDVVIYDSVRQTLSSDDFEPIPDSDGNLYTVQLQPVANLKLYDLFNRVFVTRMSFDAWETNIPNFPINQAQFTAGQPYVSTIKGIIGMFQPEFREVDGKLWIRDTTANYPNGFPAALDITLNDLTELQVSEEYNRLDAMRLLYSSDRRNYDFTTERTEETVSTVGNWGEPDYQVTTTTRTITEYRRDAQPFIIADEDVKEVHIETVIGIGIYTIYESTETFFYDQMGNQTRRTKSVLRMLPDIPNSNTLMLKEAATENETWKYRPHPFQAGRKYMSEHSQIENALIAVDSENQQLGQNYERALVDVYRAGNAAESMTTRLGAVRIFEEKQKPLRDGRCRLDRQETDVLAKQVTVAESQTVSGDIAMNGLVKEQRPMFVFDEENATRTTERVEDFNGGEVPLNILIPLVKRVLKNRKTRPRRISGGLVGYDRRLTSGTSVGLTVRNAENLGTFIIEGFNVEGDRNGHFMSITCRQG